MVDSSFIEIGAILGLALVGGLLAKFLKQPIIVSYIVVGVVGGPAVLGILSGEGDIKLLAKLGIAMLLFLVGLKLDYHLIRQIGPVALLTGFGQVILTAGAGYLAALALGWSGVYAVYIAVALTFSSTIIVIKMLGDRREIDQLHGRIAVGVLIVQDILVVIAMLAIVTVGQPGESMLLVDIAWTLGGGLIFLLAVAAIARWVLPRLLDWMAKSQELTLVFGVSWAVALAAASAWLGLSMEIGAFVAGVALASTPYRESLGARLVSLRDIMVLFFFIELGSSLTLDGAISQLVPALILTIFVLLGKPLIVLLVMGLQGYRARVSFRTGLVLAQISEFSLILIALALSVGQVDNDVVSLITLVAIFTITISTYFISYQGHIVKAVDPLLRRIDGDRTLRAEVSKESHPYDAIVIGAGRLGSDIVKGLKGEGAELLVVDQDPRALKAIDRFDVDTLYGDASDPDFLKVLPIHETQTVVCAAPDRATNLVVLETLQRLGFTGSVCLTALDRATADTFESYEQVTVIRPFQMAAQSVVVSMKSRWKTPNEK
jgi:Kef-type K+ transport system membrane component KefB